MAKKKKNSCTVTLYKTEDGTPFVIQTDMFVKQPGDPEVVVVADNLPTTPGTYTDEVATHTGNKSHESIESPYAYRPVEIDCGPGLATFWVPKQLLRSPKWSTTDAGETLCLPGVSAATGHTLVHYLYTGTYQALEAKGEHTATPEHVLFKQALLTFVLASEFELQGLVSLAKEQIEVHGDRMTLVEVLWTVRSEFSKLACPMFNEYLESRIKEQFDLDFTFFTSKDFLGSIGKTKLHRFMTSYLLEIFSEKLTHTLQSREGHGLGKEKHAALMGEIEVAPVSSHSCTCCHGEHPICKDPASDEITSEYLNVSCKGVDDTAIPDDLSIPACSAPESPIEVISYSDVSDINKNQEERLVKEAGDTQLSNEAEEEAEREQMETAEEREAVAAACAAPDRDWAESAADDWGSFAVTAITEKKKKKKSKKNKAIPASTFDYIKHASEAARIAEKQEAETALSAEGEADDARIAKEVEAARPIIEEEERKNKVEEELLKDFGGRSIWVASKSKETVKENGYREKQEREDREKKRHEEHERQERLAQEEADRLAVEEQARVEAEKAEAAFIMEEMREEKEEAVAAIKSFGWGLLSKKKKSVKQRRARKAKEQKARDEVAVEERLVQEAIEAKEAPGAVEAGESVGVMSRDAEEADATRVAEETSSLALWDEEKKEEMCVIEKETRSPPSPAGKDNDPDADLFVAIKDIPEDQLLADLKEDMQIETKREELSSVGGWDKNPEPEPEKEDLSGREWGGTKDISGFFPESSSTLCPLRFVHLSEGDGWKSCERCCATLKRIAVQLG